MKTTLLLILLTLPALAQNYYDHTGAYQGRIDKDGRFYDRTGAYQGRRDQNGRFYDRTGA